MNCKLRKIRAKVVFFRELGEICVKKSGDFWKNEEGQRAKRGKHFAILAVLDEKHFAIVAVLREKILRFLQFLAKNILR